MPNAFFLIPDIRGYCTLSCSNGGFFYQWPTCSSTL